MCSFSYRILKDHTDSTGLQSVALDSVKETLEVKEREAQQLQAECSKAQVGYVCGSSHRALCLCEEPPVALLRKDLQMTLISAN